MIYRAYLPGACNVEDKLHGWMRPWQGTPPLAPQHRGGTTQVSGNPRKSINVDNKTTRITVLRLLTAGKMPFLE